MSKHEIGCLNHCPRGNGGGGGFWLAVIAIVGAVVAGAAWEHRRGVETGLNIGLWIAMVVIGLLAASLIALIAVKLTHRVRAAQAQRPARPAVLPLAEPAYKITRIGNRKVAAIEPARAEPQYWWQQDTDWRPAQTPVPVHPEAGASPRARQEISDDDDPRAHSRFR